MFIFSKFLSFIFFWANLVPKSLNQLKFATEVHCYMLVRILTFIFSIFFSFIFLGQIWSRNLKYFKLTEITYRGTLLCAYCNFDVYFFKIIVIHIFWANMVPKSIVLQIYLNMIQGYNCYILISILMFIFWVI